MRKKVQSQLRAYGIAAVIVAAIAGILYLFFLDIKQAQDKKDAVAIDGYDVMAYYDEGKAVKGSKQYEWQWNKSTWRFHSPQHLERFRANPDKFAPQYGGNCAFTTSMGKAQQGLPKYWEIRAGKLYLNSNFVSHLLWKAMPKRLTLANKHWKILTARPKD